MTVVNSAKKTAFQMEPEDVTHGVEGHIGYKCGQCAREAPVVIQLADSGGEYWQNLQLLWQEECDVLQNSFDADVAAHFPNHKPIGCTECPTPFAMPVKPNPPSERAVRQNAK